MSKYWIEQIQAQDVLKVWSDSPQSTVFTHPEVLDKLATEVHWWGVYKGKELQCVWPIALDESFKPIVAPFTYWQGPLWTKIGFNHPAHRTLTVLTCVYELFISFFINKYGSIKASLHPSLQDVRVFDWWNYNENEKPKFIIKPRYTAVINNLNENISTLKANFRTNRKREIKKIENIDNFFYLDTHCNLSEIQKLHSKILKTNGDQSLNSLLKIVKMGFGWIQSIRKVNDSSLCGLVLILNDKTSANLVLNLVDDEFKNHSLMASLILEALKTSQQKGLICFDFNGANSPFRGDDKHSYGAKSVLYFDVEYHSKS